MSLKTQKIAFTTGAALVGLLTISLSIPGFRLSAPQAIASEIPALSAKIPSTASANSQGSTPTTAPSQSKASNKAGGDPSSLQREVFRVPMLEGISLTQNQKDEVVKILREARSKIVGTRDQVAKLRQEINSNLESTAKIDIAHLQDIVHQEEAIHNKIDSVQVEATAKIHNLLTPDQIHQGIKTRTEIAKLASQIRALQAGQPNGGQAQPTASH